jgi:hypothetical protein
VLPLTSVRLLIAWVVLLGAMKVESALARTAEPPVGPHAVPVPGVPDSVKLPPRHHDPLPDPTDSTITRLDSEVELDELLDDELSTSLPPIPTAAEPVIGRLVDFGRATDYFRLTGLPQSGHLRC